MIETIGFKLNGRPVNLKVDGERKLLWVLRTDLGITGPKYGCGEGLCGACTVLEGNVTVLACQKTIREVDGSEITTIEGLAKNGVLHPLQTAFIEHVGFQCGYCTPGMILKAYSLLADNPTPSRDEIIAGMDENLCRCGAHTRIVAAIETASRQMKGGMK
ncbi:MAG: (2Fe-2S)-binding protein [Desulfobacteraceae bacterium]|jgi:aerobic-type carbon monoxide dehydrogenase small subunit (CoxS/CutS family)